MFNPGDNRSHKNFTRMKKYQIFIIFSVTVHFLMYASFALGQDRQLKMGNWTITTDLEKSALTIEYEHLGPVLNNAQLLLKQGDGWKKLSDWQVTVENQRLLIHTEDPATDWTIDVHNRVLGMTTSVSEGLLTGEAPADKNRFPARMIDYSGSATPVAWKGTNETGYSYGGMQTKNFSFLPAENPEVLYLSLGQVSSRDFAAMCLHQGLDNAQTQTGTTRVT
jgi:hypothetical protein